MSYVQPSGVTWVLRYDTVQGTTTSHRISTGGLNLSATWTPVATSDGSTGATASYTWTKQVVVAVTPQGQGAPAAQTYNLAPLSADPMSPTVSGPC